MMFQLPSMKCSCLVCLKPFRVQTLSAALAIIRLPRQFHVAMVELRDEKHIGGARRWFAVYLILTTIAIVPIASWALHAAPQYLAIPMWRYCLYHLAITRTG